MEKIEYLNKLIDDFNNFHKITLPLCAAENILSDFCKLPLSSNLQEYYIMGSEYSYSNKNNFIGSDYLLPFYQMISQECNLLFNAKYTDARTFTGMNCLTTLLMSLTNIGDKLLILGDEWGGHASVKEVCKRLGLEIYFLPYDFSNFDIDYEAANKLIVQHNIKYILLAPSDLQFIMDVYKFNLDSTVLLYDISQIMGLIAGKCVKSPLDYSDNIVIFGGTHKTFPGPASGLIMTNNISIHNKLDSQINPKYLRNTQMHQKVCLLYALIEMEYFGIEYAHNIIDISNILSLKLCEKHDFYIPQKEGKYSQTHQIFIYLPHKITEVFYNNALTLGITLNSKYKRLFNDSGIRLGTQTIARYRWNDEYTLDNIASILSDLRYEVIDKQKIKKLMDKLPDKIINYTFNHEIKTENL